MNNTVVEGANNRVDAQDMPYLTNTPYSPFRSSQSPIPAKPSAFQDVSIAKNPIAKMPQSETPSRSGISEQKSVMGAAGVVAGATLGGSIIGGLTNIGSTLLTNANERSMQSKQLDFDQKKLDFKGQELQFQKDQWNRGFDVAHSMGLAAPSQINNPTLGGHGAMVGRNFTAVSSSPYSNNWSG
jgi:hypothetical protein